MKQIIVYIDLIRRNVPLGGTSEFD